MWLRLCGKNPLNAICAARQSGEARHAIEACAGGAAGLTPPLASRIALLCSNASLSDPWMWCPSPRMTTSASRAARWANGCSVVYPSHRRTELRSEGTLDQSRRSDRANARRVASSHADAVISVTVLARLALRPKRERRRSAKDRKSWKTVLSPTKSTDVPASALHARSTSKRGSVQPSGDHS